MGAAAAAAAGHDTDTSEEPVTPASAADNQLIPAAKAHAHGRHVTTSSTLKRLSVTRMNFYMRYLHPLAHLHN